MNKPARDAPASNTAVSEKIIRCLCSIRLRTVVVLLIMFAFMLAAFAIILGSVVPTSFSTAETDNIENALSRTMRALYDNFMVQLRSQLAFVAWDPTYYLTLNDTAYNTANYIAQNYNNETMIGLGLSMVLHYLLNGTLILHHTFDLVTGTPDTLPIPEALQFLPPNSPILKNANITTTRFGGFLFDASGNLLVITGMPIQKSDLTGPVPGVALWVTILTSSDVLNLAQRTQLCITIYEYNATGTNSALLQSYSSLIASTTPIGVSASTPNWANDNPFLMQDLPNSLSDLQGRQCWLSQDANMTGASRYSALGLLPDITGQKSLIVRIDTNRNLRNLGLASLGWSLGMVALVVVIATIVILIYVEFSVLFPMLRLGSRVNSITKTLDVKTKLKEGLIRDELSSMTKDINGILSSLDIAQQKLADEQEKLQEVLQKTGVEEQRARTIMNAIPDYVMCVRSDGIIHHSNQSFLSAFQFSAAEVNGKMPVERIFVNTKLNNFVEQCNNGTSVEREMIAAFDKIPVIVTVTPITIFVDERATQAYVVLARNISERKSLQNSIEAERRRLAEAQQNLEFDALWRDKRRRLLFTQYCTRMMSDENVKFLEAVEEYRSIRNQQKRVEMQKWIYSQFLIAGKSPYELNISAKTVKDLSLIENGYGQLDLFDSVEQAIRQQVIMDTYLRFLEYEMTLSDTDTDLHSSIEGSVELSSSVVSVIRDKMDKSDQDSQLTE
jgi:PAS domain S-box-containing protein